MKIRRNEKRIYPWRALLTINTSFFNIVNRISQNTFFLLIHETTNWNWKTHYFRFLEIRSLLSLWKKFVIFADEVISCKKINPFPPKFYAKRTFEQIDWCWWSMLEGYWQVYSESTCGDTAKWLGTTCFPPFLGLNLNVKTIFWIPQHASSCNVVSKDFFLQKLLDWIYNWFVTSIKIYPYTHTLYRDRQTSSKQFTDLHVYMYIVHSMRKRNRVICVLCLTHILYNLYEQVYAHKFTQYSILTHASLC